MCGEYVVSNEYVGNVRGEGRGGGGGGKSGIKKYDPRKKVHNLHKRYETRIQGTQLD